MARGIGARRSSELYGGLLGDYLKQAWSGFGGLLDASTSDPRRILADTVITAGLAASGDPKSKQAALDQAAMSTGLLGDFLGPLADAHRFLQFPEERTAGNAALAGLGALPFIPHMGGMVKSLPNPERARRANELTRQSQWEALEKANKQAGVKRSPTTGRYVGAGKDVTSPQKRTAIVNKYEQRVQNALDAGIPPGYFYASGRNALAGVTDSPYDHWRLAQVYGPTSTQVGPFQNTNYAIRAFDQASMGDPISVSLYPNSLRPTVESALYGDDPWKGYKVDRYSYLLGPGDPYAHPLQKMPPNDQWEGFGTGGEKGVVPSGPTQVAFADDIRQRVADRINRKRIADGLRPLSLEEVQELHWAAIRAETEGRALQLNPGDTVQGSLPAFEFSHSWEAAPGARSGMSIDMDPQAYMGEMTGLLMDPTGKDRLIRSMGGSLQSPGIPGVGVYDGMVSPGMQSRSYVSHTAANGLDPASLARVDSTEAVRQYMLGQDARAGHVFTDKVKSLAEIDTADISLGGTIAPDASIQLQQRLSEAFDNDAFIVPTERGYRVLYTGDDNRAFQKIIGEMGLEGELTLGKRKAIYAELPEGSVTQNLLDTLGGYDHPGPMIRANSAETREIAGQISDLYKRLEAEGKLTGSQKLSAALDAWNQRGLDGLRDLVKQGLAPAVLLSLLGGGVLLPQEPQQSPEV